MKPDNSSYFAGHDAPHLGQTLGLDAVGNLLRLVGVALIDRRYDLVISRRLELIPECLEVGGRLGGGAGHASKHGFQLGAWRLPPALSRSVHPERIRLLRLSSNTVPYARLRAPRRRHSQSQPKRLRQTPIRDQILRLLRSIGCLSWLNSLSFGPHLSPQR